MEKLIIEVAAYVALAFYTLLLQIGLEQNNNCVEKWALWEKILFVPLSTALLVGIFLVTENTFFAPVFRSFWQAMMFIAIVFALWFQVPKLSPKYVWQKILTLVAISLAAVLEVWSLVLYLN